ncbi:Uu.00g025750.m01.CDS01 [Anthostomella pinea]|uniref:Uu.00g025750.m01.CDS01 n=1 Tax=Anthostomella pinea TaxID=933095 RepID=A0AAI8V7Z0_9PEZI|nr:Uu.00g025750.m01.CDS01 [Anthostomella pinea]
MKFLAGVLAFVAALAGHAAAGSVLEMYESQYPTCALACMLKTVPSSGCLNGTDIEQVTCLCTNEALQAEITECVLGGCTIYEGLMTKNTTLTMCGAKPRDESLTPLLVGVVGGAIALLVFILRMCSTLPSGGRVLGWDDWTIAIAVVLAVPPTVFSVLLSNNGLGKDMWTLPLKNIENVLFYYYLGEIFYFASLSVNKISLLLFILRVFPEKKFRRIVFIVCGLCVGYGAGFIFATIFQCSPVDYSWLQVDSTVAGHCNNINLQGWMSAICNILLDLLIIALPLRNLYHLQINFKTKIMIMFMFSLGIFVTVVSVVRLRSLILFASTQNPTWDYNEAAWWSTIELHVGIICACLPSLRSLFVNLGLRILGSSNGQSKATGYATGTMSRGGGSRLAGHLANEKQAPAQSTPKRGDESDFIPLVDVPETKIHREFTTVIEESDSNDSFDSRKSGYQARAYR